MANLFKNITVIRCQPVRFLPRFSQTWPDKHEPPNNLVTEATPKHEFAQEIVPEAAAKRAPTYPKINWKQPRSLVIQTAKEKSKKPQTISQKLEQVNEYTIDDNGNLLYTKMLDNDVRINKIMSSIKTKRKGNELMLLEGKRLIEEALKSGCKLEYILFSRLKEVEYLKPWLPKKGRLYKMPYKEMQIWSDLTTTPGIMGIFQVPPFDYFKPKNPLPLTIICDNVREPNNLGAILRTSGGVGCEQVLLTKGCVNVWDTKVLRSACGAHFRVKISSKTDWDEITAAFPKNANVFIADNNTITTREQNLNVVEDLAASVPVLPYFSTNFSTSRHIVLIVGGETEGISAESYELARQFNGVRLNVPLSNGVDSLNTGTALGIIAFEIKRQLLRNLNAAERVDNN